MKNEHKLLIFFSVVIIVSFILVQTYSAIRNVEIYEDKNQLCMLLGQNITNEPSLNESFIESCECRYENVISRNMTAMCVCDCYTDGTVCPRVKDGRCYISVMLTDTGKT
jgi:hypothetical protein